MLTTRVATSTTEKEKMSLLPEKMKDEHVFRPALQKAAFDFTWGRILHQLDINKAEVKNLGRSIDGKVEAEQLVATQRGLAEAIGFWNGNAFSKTSPSYKLLMISWALDLDYDELLEPMLILKTVLLQLEKNRSKGITINEIDQAVAGFYETPRQTEKVERLLNLLIE